MKGLVQRLAYIAGSVVCRARGHVNAAWMLPEETFGLYAYSRLFCSRCDTTFDERPGRLPDGTYPAP
jgi:hypothetical protein